MGMWLGVPKAWIGRAAANRDICTKVAAVGNAQCLSLSNPALCLCHRARELQLRRSKLGLVDNAVLASGSRRRWLSLYVGGM
jgi:hypothetical protein